MTGSFLETEIDAIGVLVLEEFACFQAVRFIEFISQSKEIPRQYLRWQDSVESRKKVFTVITDDATSLLKE